MNILHSARGTALTVLFQVLERDAYANQALEAQLSVSRLPAADRRLVTEIVSGTLRQLVYLDWVLAHLLQKDPARLNPWLRQILRLSAYQLLGMERTSPHAVVHGAVELTRAKAGPGLASLCNGVLRNLLRKKDEIPAWLSRETDELTRQSVQYALPADLLRLFRAAVPAEDLNIVLDYLNQTPPVTLRVNTLRLSREDLLRALSSPETRGRHLASDISSTPPDSSPAPAVFPQLEADPDLPCAISVQGPAQALRDFAATGWFSVQSAASMLAAYLLAPQPGQTVYDLCAGVGGKTAHIAEFMRQRGRIVAVDLYAAKLRVLHANCQRLGIDIVETLTADARTPALLPPASADAVLLDAPCSGWGVLNRRPDLRHHQSPQRRAELYPLQRELLRAAAELVRPGGVLLYVTCTLNPEENERQIAAFLRDDPRYLSADATARVPFFPWREAERQSLETGNLTLLPGIYGTDGMYYALLRRQA